MIIEVTFELIACDSHSQEMSFIPYFIVILYLISDHRKISLNTLFRTLLRHTNIFLESMHLTVKYEGSK